jgi:hypothetical protein
MDTNVIYNEDCIGKNGMKKSKVDLRLRNWPITSKAILP